MAAPLRVLALSPIPEEGAGCRFRIAQFIPHLRSVGIDVTLRTLYTAEFFHRVYQRGHYLEKARRFTTLSLKHLASLRDIGRFDVVFLYREMFPVGPAIVERFLGMRRRPRLVFDFDDAIFLPSVSDANRVIQALKWPGKVATIIRRSDHVVAGNAYLAQYAARFNPAVTVIPTCVDTARFVPSGQAAQDGSDERPIVGWIGSPTTASYIRALIPVLRQASQQHPFVLRISGAGEPFDHVGVPLQQPGWTINGEVALFNSCDIGIYPLADDEWSKGKCGFKAIEFMACGVPVVASAIGVNREIIEDGHNGFLASNPSEWIERLLRLLNDSALRRRIGTAGRATVEARYSLREHAPKLADVFRRVADGRRE